MSSSRSGTNLIFLDIDGVLNVTNDHKYMTLEKFFVRDSMVNLLAEIIVETDAKIVLSSTWRFNPKMSQMVKNEVSKALYECQYSKQDKYSSDFFSTNQHENLTPVEMYGDIICSFTPDLEGFALKTESKNLGKLYSEQLQPIPENCHETRTDEILLWLKENVDFEFETDEVFKSDHKICNAEKGDIKNSQWLLEEKIKVKNFICLDDINLHYYSCYRLKSKIKEHLVLTKTGVGLTKKHAEIAIRKLKNEDFCIQTWAKETFAPCDKFNCYHKKVDQLVVEAKKSFSEKQFTTGRANTAPTLELKKLDKAKLTKSSSLMALNNSGYDCVL